MNPTQSQLTRRLPFPQTRRGFLGTLAASTAALASGCATSASRPVGTPIAFNTANLVGRFTNYRFELTHWADQHQLTVKKTDAAAWAAICRDIAAAGFRAVEIWEAHAAPESLDRSDATQWKRILEDHGLRAIAYAGSLRRETIRICQWLGIPRINGSLRGLKPDAATELCRAAGIRFNFENHPEKTAGDILAAIDGGNDWLGVCIDTGWLGTQGANAPATIRELAPLVRHTHLKDVQAAGAHQTCLLGEGVVNVAGCIATLRATGYRGWYSWEDEPEDRNPFDSAARNREWIKDKLRAS